MASFRTRTPEETEALGALLAEVLPEGMVVALEGSLGVGKSVLARGALRRLTGSEVLPSPTFTFVATYPGEICHADLYRLADEGEDLAEYFLPPYRTFVEWPGKAPWLLPDDRLELFLSRSGEELRIEARATGPRSRATLAAWWARAQAFAEGGDLRAPQGGREQRRE